MFGSNPSQGAGGSLFGNTAGAPSSFGSNPSQTPSLFGGLTAA